MNNIHRFFCLSIACFLGLRVLYPQAGYPLEPVSGADGVFEIIWMILNNLLNLNIKVTDRQFELSIL